MQNSNDIKLIKTKTLNTAEVFQQQPKKSELFYLFIYLNQSDLIRRSSTFRNMYLSQSIKIY